LSFGLKLEGIKVLDFCKLDLMGHRWSQDMAI
jgi:hypothetical protein